ncbi:uncharacterized protein LOC106156903 [Lingula anatina]|uniref:Uncharacterized protein LOC106156903 n=1 Tax=Lingula anatina TaxID=7574 RepID=A0A1S3HQI0_LINAN|nr:uncharacterized protein LOC106156903 [Lingula anatina]|eukprot:XP_013387796.1 uncharacterized protein LOC106156903 [Lingula anatina]
MSHQGGPSKGGVIAGTVIAVLLVLVILILGLLWWKRRDMLLSLFNKGKGKSSTNEYDSPYVYQDPHGIKSIKENPTKNKNDSSVHIYSEPSKTSPKPTYKGDQSPVLMRNNTLYSAGTDEPFYNTADDPKYYAANSNDYTYTQPSGFKSDPKENHYYTTPGKADDVYYSTVAKEVDDANEQNRRWNGDTPQSNVPQYADVIPRSKRASDPNVADDIDDYCLAREPNPTNQQEPYYFVLENPADTTHYQNTN